MADASVSGVVHNDAGTPAGGAKAALGLAGCLGLAAAPTFVAMALWTAMDGGRPDALCTVTQRAFLIGPMTAMYLLMGLFHAGPWLRLISSR